MQIRQHALGRYREIRDRHHLADNRAVFLPLDRGRLDTNLHARPDGLAAVRRHVDGCLQDLPRGLDFDHRRTNGKHGTTGHFEFDDTPVGWAENLRSSFQLGRKLLNRPPGIIDLEFRQHAIALTLALQIQPLRIELENLVPCVGDALPRIVEFDAAVLEIFARHESARRGRLELGDLLREVDGALLGGGDDAGPTCVLCRIVCKLGIDFP